MTIEGIEIIGFLAAAATVAAFFCRDMLALRAFAILANVLFLAYGLGLSLLPVVALHGVLLPLNVLRLSACQTRADAPVSRQASAERGMAP
ncbi:hypothetical protein [Alsobacter sp. R-9]